MKLDVSIFKKKCYKEQETVINETKLIWYDDPLHKKSQVLLISAVL